MQFSAGKYRASLSLLTPVAKRYGELCPSKSEVRLIQVLTSATPPIESRHCNSGPSRNANPCPKLGKLAIQTHCCSCVASTFHGSVHFLVHSYSAISITNWLLRFVGLCFGILVRPLALSAFVRISHERPDMYRRLTGGFATMNCSRRQSRRTERCLRNLQRPCLQRFRLSC